MNFVSGKVARETKTSGTVSLVKGDFVGTRETVSTGVNGRAEILLNPGSFVRLGENSEFEIINESLDDLQVKLNHGSAVFEVTTDDDFKITVAAADSQFRLIKTGIYRIDSAANGSSTIRVWKGRAEVAGLKDALKGGRTASVANGQVVAAKFDKDDKGELDNWSRERAKDIAKVNSKLREREMSSALISSYAQRGWNTGNGFGLWVRDPFTRNYSFLPYSYGWNSPYGYGFSRSIWSYRLPSRIIYVPRRLSSPNKTYPRRPRANPPSGTPTTQRPVSPNPGRRGFPRGTVRRKG